jgi:hypothetical protein
MELHDRLMVAVRIECLELNEAGLFVAKKERPASWEKPHASMIFPQPGE